MLQTDLKWQETQLSYYFLLIIFFWAVFLLMIVFSKVFIFAASMFVIFVFEAISAALRHSVSEEFHVASFDDSIITCLNPPHSLTHHLSLVHSRGIDNRATSWYWLSLIV